MPSPLELQKLKIARRNGTDKSVCIPSARKHVRTHAYRGQEWMQRLALRLSVWQVITGLT